MEFDTDWRTLGKHRIKLRSTKGFPTELMQQLAGLTRLAVDNNMSARARIVEIVFRHEKAYDITIGTTLVEDRICATQLESAIAAVRSLDQRILDAPIPVHLPGLNTVEVIGL